VNETLSVLIGLINAIAAAVGAWIAVAQWRASRSRPPITTPPPRASIAPAWLPAPAPTPVAPRQEGRKLARTAAVAVASGAVAAVFSALTDLVYGLEQATDEEHGSLLTVLASVLYLAALVAFLLGLFVLVAGLVKRRKRIARLGLLAVLLSQTLWLAMWLASFM
jgi:membrane associated rhomboid family serine protease